jgi:4-aminobutyrate aminotransferase-like enzyme
MASQRRVGPSSYFNPDRVDALDPATAALVRRRMGVLGPAYRLFYEQPVQIVRGEGVHLYDQEGAEYLDVYNNVASLGHAHPRVTAAIAEQAGVLNTHTRYLHEGIVHYAEDRSRPCRASSGTSCSRARGPRPATWPCGSPSSTPAARASS